VTQRPKVVRPVNVKKEKVVERRRRARRFPGSGSVAGVVTGRHRSKAVLHPIEYLITGPVDFLDYKIAGA